MTQCALFDCETMTIGLEPETEAFKNMAITHCISIKEPWVSLITSRQKTLEYRSRKLIARPPETIALATSKAGAGDFLPGGHIVGVARISAVVPWRDDSRDFWERACMIDGYDAMLDGEFGGMGGGYAMMIGGFAACEPVPVRGNVGLYKVPDGFTPRYAETPEQLLQWWGAARVWHDGPADDDERALMDSMRENGVGWRIDD